MDDEFKDLLVEVVKRTRRFKHIEKLPKNRRETSRYKKMLARIVVAIENYDLKTKEGRSNLVKVVLEAKEMLRM